MQNILKKLIYFPLFLIITSTFIYAEDSFNIDYYGIVSQEIDNNMAKMTSDLYYTQLSELLPNCTVYDKRNTPCKSEAPDCKNIDTENLIFYSEITKQNDTSWTVSFNVFNGKTKQTFAKNKVYDSFYKILIESKNELKLIVNKLVEGDPSLLKTEDNSPSISKPKSEDVIIGKKLKIKSTEELSGTWNGESSIDKIVILRGGRGFVIFDNGASMNISVTIENTNDEQEIVIKQKSNSNASFYPELPRKIALDAAIAAPPIKWTMTLYDDMVMRGTKNTLVQDNDSFKIGNIPVIWEKIN